MSTLKINTILHSSGSTTTEPSIPALDQRMAKAWVNFNGTGTVAIGESYNVSSITDGGVGTYTVNLSITLPTTNYTILTNAARHMDTITAVSGTARYASYFSIWGFNYSGSSADSEYISAAILAN
jgi:hypothetical protein